MKFPAAFFLIWLAATFGSTSIAGSLTYDSGVELAASLDANGDGLSDWIIVDKATGVRQLGIQQTDGSLVWAEPDSVGLQQVTALTIGQFAGGAGAEGFAVASPTWNAIDLFANTSWTGLTVPNVGIGPNVVAAFDFSGDGWDDLAVATEWDSPPTPSNLSGLQVNAQSVGQTYGPMADTGLLSQGNRVRFSSDRPWMMSALRQGTDGVDFVSRPLFNFPGGQNGPDLTGLATNTVWTWGEFATNAPDTFLFYIPSQSFIAVDWVDEPSPFQFVWNPGANFDLGQPISQVTVVPGGASSELLVVFGDGSTAAVYDFDGVNAPMLRQSLTAPAGTKYSLGVSLGGGDFGLLHGPAGALGNSAGWQHWQFDGQQYNLLASGALPRFTLAQSRANVLVYSADPTLWTDAPLLQSFRVGEWSDLAVLTSGALSVTHEQTLSPTLGLGNPTVSPVFGVVGLFPAVNQRSVSESSVVLAPPGTQPRPPISFNPPPGAYPLASNATLVIRMTTTTTDPIFYRTSLSDPWSTYDPGQPLTLSGSTIVYAFVNGAPASPICTSVYTIGDAPPLAPPIPSDPWSAWAQAFGLTDPNGDADGDGFTNLQECQAGTDPLDPRSNPGNTGTTDPGTITLVIRPPGPSAPVDTLFEIAWPATAVGLTLQTAIDLSGGSPWSTAAGGIVKVGLESIYYLPTSAAQEQSFFRLHR